MRKTEPADERFVENRPQIHAIHGEIADFRRSKNDTGHYWLIPVPDLKATNSFSRISDSGDLLRISSRLIQIWYHNTRKKQ